MKLKEALTFCQLYESLRTRIIPISTAFKLAKIHNSLKDNAEFYRKTFNDLVESNSQRNEDGSFKYNEDGTMILLKKDCIDNWNQRLKELNELEITPSENYLTIEELEPLELSLEEVEILMNFIK